MALALLLTLLLPVVQDDPQVTYREGLFEEVDQGNLEKAAELYGKILKSGAPDALKAKALLRTGFCHEKKGKKKEAEQAWRDVIERYPGAAETVKLARERIDSVEAAAAPNPTLEAQIRELILDLGSHDSKVQANASRRLVLLGDPAIPELRRALAHKDSTLSLAAANVLIQVQSYSGLYDILMRRWPKESGELNGSVASNLITLLRNSPPDRARFVKDSEALRKGGAFPHFAGWLLTIPDRDLATFAEAAAVEADGREVPSSFYKQWLQKADVAEARRIVKKLSGSTPSHHQKVVHALESFASNKSASDSELKAALQASLAGYPDAGWLLVEDVFLPHWILAYLTPSEFVRGPVATWLAKSAPEIRDRILNSLFREINQPRLGTELAKELRGYLFDFLATPDQPMELKERIFAYGFDPQTAEEWERILAYCLKYYQEHKNDPQGTPLLQSVAERLLHRLPLDSKELPHVIETALGYGSPFELEETRNAALRGQIVAAAIRNQVKLKGNQLEDNRFLNAIERLATPSEKATLARILPGLPDVQALQSIATLYTTGLLNLPEAERDAAWKETGKLIADSPLHVQQAVASRLSANADDPHLNALMSDLASSKDIPLRSAAINHFGTLNAPNRLAYLLPALRDKSEEIQIMAIQALASRPVFEAIPELIRLFDASSKDVKDAAQMALQTIKAHYEAQAEWKRWYDDLKKTLGK